jgi:hypothetical protein
MVAVDIDRDGNEELAASFPGFGLYILDETSGWSSLSALTPDGMVDIGTAP